MKKSLINVTAVIIFLTLCFSASAANRLRVSGDNTWVAFVNGKKVGEGNDWQAVGEYTFDLIGGGAVIAIYVHDAEPGASGRGGALADVVLDDGRYFGTDKTWKANAGKPIAERKDGWERIDYDDRNWEPATQLDKFGSGIWGFGADAMRKVLKNPDCNAYWVWAGPNDVADDIYLRFTIPGTQLTPVKSAGKATTFWGELKIK